jgi:hypothetical protein
MSGPGPGQTHRACIEIKGPMTTQQIKECMGQIKAILSQCGGHLTQENVRDPLAGSKSRSRSRSRSRPRRRRSRR